VITSHPANTIPDHLWRSITHPRLKCVTPADWVRHTKAAGQQYRAAKKGLN
jgi:hypothetical protein